MQWWLGLVKERGEMRPDSVASKKKKAMRTKSDPARDALLRATYEVLHPIAAGAFSTILKCKHSATGVEVAVKSFDAATCAKDDTVGDARDRELGVLRVLNSVGKRSGDGGGPHPHIASMLEELGDASTTHIHAVLEFCVGGSLSRHLKNLKTPMEVVTAQVATYQITSALAHLHSLEIAHADLKPANVLLMTHTADGKPLDPKTMHLKLCDFGFAWQCRGNVKSKTFCGTPPYLAPEVASPTEASKGYHGRPVDMWALGCVVYELFHKSLAFVAPEQFQLESRIRNGHHQPLDKTVPSGARSLISGLLTINANKRLTAAQVLETPWVSDSPKADVSGSAGSTAAQIKEADKIAKDPLGATATDHLADLFSPKDGKDKNDWGRSKKKRIELAKAGKVPYRNMQQQMQRLTGKASGSPSSSPGGGGGKAGGQAEGKVGKGGNKPGDDSWVGAEGTFIASVRWDGPRDHMVYRSGALGQGYYLDVYGGATLADIAVAAGDMAGWAAPCIEEAAAPTGGGAEAAEASPPQSPPAAEEEKKEEGGWLSWLGIPA